MLRVILVIRHELFLRSSNDNPVYGVTGLFDAGLEPPRHAAVDFESWPLPALNQIDAALSSALSGEIQPRFYAGLRAVSVEIVRWILDRNPSA